MVGQIGNLAHTGTGQHIGLDADILQQGGQAVVHHDVKQVIRQENVLVAGHQLVTLEMADLLHGAVRLPDLGEGSGLDRSLLLAQRQALDAAEAVVDRIALRRHCANDAPVLHIEVEITVDRAEIAGRLYFLHIHHLVDRLFQCNLFLYSNL